MSSGGGQTTTTQQSTSAPYAPTQPYINDLLGKASSLYDQTSQNTDYAPFNTVAQPSADTQMGLDLTRQRALNGSPITQAAGNSLTSILQSSGQGPGQDALSALLGYTNPATAMAGNLAQNGPDMAGNSTLQAGANGAYTNAALPMAGQYANQDPNANPASKYLSGMASDGNINPYLDALYGAASKPVIDSVNAQFSQAGRTGSGANQQLLTRDLGDLSSQIHGQGWQQAIQNQLAATGQIQGAFDNASGRNLTATGLLGQYSGQDIANRLGAAQNLNSGNLAAFGQKQSATSLLGDLNNSQAQTRGNAAEALNSQYNTNTGQKLQAAQLAPSLANNDYADLQNLLNVGGAQDAQSASQIQDLLTRWQYQQQQPWNLLNNYSGLITGYAGLGGTASGSGTKTEPAQSLIPSLLGAGVSLFGGK